MKKSLFKVFMEKLMTFPLWVRQAIYLRLASDMRVNLCEDFIRSNASSLLSIYSPILTFKGRTELLERKSGLDNNIYNFLNFCSHDFSILEISLNTFLSMEEVCKFFVFCIDQDFVEVPKAKEIKAMTGFIAGKYRIGEYFLTNGLITQEQLQVAIQEHLKYNEKFGETLLHLGFITEINLKSVVILKEEAKKRFIMDYSLMPNSKVEKDEEFDPEELMRLREENSKLRFKLENLLSIVRKYEK